MRNSKRVVGKTKRYRSSMRPASPVRRYDAETIEAAERVSNRSTHSWAAKAFATLMLVLMIGALFAFFTEDWFFINQFEIQGLNYLTPEQVERASGVSGFNIFFLEPRAVEKALAKTPEIKSARVTAGMPNLILVQAQERAPEAVWVKGNQTYWVDAEGVAFQARVSQVDLPTVRDLDGVEVRLGKPVQIAALNAIRSLRAAWADAPKIFDWSAASGLSATDEHGWKILFGDAKDMDFKVAKLQALVPTLVAQGARIKYIDLGKGDPYYQ